VPIRALPSTRTGTAPRCHPRGQPLTDNQLIPRKASPEHTPAICEAQGRHVMGLWDVREALEVGHISGLASADISPMGERPCSVTGVLTPM
jgi:hypothetical protein